MKNKTVLLAALGMLFPIITQAQSETLDTLRINNMIDFRSGLLAPISNNVNPFIYRSKDANTTYPFSQNGNLVLQTRTSANRDIVFMAGSPTAVPVMNITSAGDVGIGTSSPQGILHTSRLNAGGKTIGLIIQNPSIVTDTESSILFVNRNDNPLTAPYRRGELAMKADGSGKQDFYVRLADGSGLADRFYIDGNNGNTGIGNTTPSSRLHIESGSIDIASTSPTSANLIIQGTSSSRSVSEGASLGFVVPSNTDGSGLWQQGRIIVTPDNIANANASGRMYLQTRYFTNGAWNWRKNLVLNSSGSVGVGTETMGTHKLAVEGTIGAREIKVEATNWPDYVFEESYTLPSLAELEAFIKANKHLPEVPSAKEVEENGIELGKMNTLLLKKIEELTLHLIQKDQEITKLTERLDSIEEKITNNN